MIKDGKGGSSTNKNGLLFESKVDISRTLEKNGFKLKETNLGKGIYKVDVENQIIFIMQKQKLYKYLSSKIEDYKSIDYVSKELWPDNCFINVTNRKVVIIEVKYQETRGSVDEKLQTCDFKKKQYEKICSPLGYDVEYIYILSDWFKDKKYNDVKKYILNSGCKYYFGELPFKEFIS